MSAAASVTLEEFRGELAKALQSMSFRSDRGASCDFAHGVVYVRSRPHRGKQLSDIEVDIQTSLLPENLPHETTAEARAGIEERLRDESLYVRAEAERALHGLEGPRLAARAAEGLGLFLYKRRAFVAGDIGRVETDRNGLALFRDVPAGIDCWLRYAGQAQGFQVPALIERGAMMGAPAAGDLPINLELRLSGGVLYCTIYRNPAGEAAMSFQASGVTPRPSYAHLQAVYEDSGKTAYEGIVDLDASLVLARVIDLAQPLRFEVEPVPPLS